MVNLQSLRPLAMAGHNLSKIVQEVKGPSEPKLLTHTFNTFMQALSNKYSNNLAIASYHQNNKEISFNELDNLCTLLASRLYEHGVRKGDKVAVCCGNLWQYPVLEFGLGRLGAVLVPLNPAFTMRQFESAIKRSESSVLIIQDSLFQGRNKPRRDMTELISLLSSTHRHKVFVLPSENTSPLGEFGEQHFDQLVEGSVSKELIKSYADQNSGDIVNMQFTSGTTSEPKISCLSHSNVINNGYLIGHRLGYKPGDNVTVPVPMFHCFGLVLSNIASLSQGAAVVYPSDGFDALESLKATRHYKSAGLNGVPTMFAAELALHEEVQKGGFENLRTGIAAGTSVPIEIMKELAAKFGMKELTICYGMTETSPVSFMSFPTDPVQKRVSTVGRIMPHTSARIVAIGDRTLTPLPLGERGEIVVSGYSLQKGYYKDPQKTDEAMITLEDGSRWMLTGDEGIIDEEGYLRVTGRIKDTIIRGGENIHPLEIEEVLFENPKISQASVVGVPDKHYGEAVAAFIVLDKDVKISSTDQEESLIAEFQQFVKEHLGHYMVPKYIYFVEDFPKTASGKIRKVDLKLLHESGDLAKSNDS